MSLRKPQSSTSETQQGADASSLKLNPEIDKKIDDFIKTNPKQYEYYNSLPKERLVRAMLLKDIQARDRNERMKSAILRKLDADPEMKKSIETLVRNMPEEKRRAATINLAARTMRMERGARPQGPSVSTGGA